MSVCEYFEYKLEYSPKEGVLTLKVFVSTINELYKRRIVIDMNNKTMNNLVDIRWVRSSYSSVEGGTDGNIFNVLLYSFNFIDSRRMLFRTVLSP